MAFCTALLSSMANEYPLLSFTFKGRIKSLIRAEEKFNGNIVEYISDYYNEYHAYPPLPELKERVARFRDLIAYRIVISLPKCHLADGVDRTEEEIKYLYDVATQMPDFLEERGFTAELSNFEGASPLNDSVRPYYKDYIRTPQTYGYQSLHITFYDNIARCYIEVQLRTKDMPAAIMTAFFTLYGSSAISPRSVIRRFSPTRPASIKPLKTLLNLPCNPRVSCHSREFRVPPAPSWSPTVNVYVPRRRFSEKPYKVPRVSACRKKV